MEKRTPISERGGEHEFAVTGKSQAHCEMQAQRSFFKAAQALEKANRQQAAAYSRYQNARERLRYWLARVANTTGM